MVSIHTLLKDVTVSKLESTPYTEGWYAVLTDLLGEIAYFSTETQARFYRLALINAQLNPIGDDF